MPSPWPPPVSPCPSWWDGRSDAAMVNPSHPAGRLGADAAAEDRELHARAHAELAVDAVQVRLHRAPRDEQPRSDLGVGQPCGDERGDLALRWAQAGPATGRLLASRAVATPTGCPQRH